MRGRQMGLGRKTLRSASLALAAIVAACAFGACQVFSVGSSARGSLSVSFSAASAKATSAKTVAVSTSGLLAMVSTLAITVLDSSGSAVQSDSAVAYSSGATKTFSYLAAGDYTISVIAYDGSGAAIASGSSAVSLAADATAAVTVALSFLQTGKGAFSLAMTWPSSTGLAYVSATLDGTALPELSVTESSGSYSTTIAKSGVASGSHALRITFKASSGSTTVGGLFYETVNVWDGITSDKWIDGSGNCVSSRDFASADFLDTNCSLGGLKIRDGSSSGSVLFIGFSSSSTSYDLYTLPSSGSIVIIPTASDEGQYISYSWNGGSSVALASDTGSTVLAFDTSAYDNTLAITVRAPDRSTTRSYSFTWHSGATTVGVSTSVSYAALGFSSSSYSIARGANINVSPSDATLAAVASGWKWYIDGVEQSGMTGPSFALSSSTTPSTSSMIGVYQVTATLSYGGTLYSGGFSLTVHW